MEEEKVFSDLNDFEMINYQVYIHNGTIGLNEVAARIGEKYDTKNEIELQSKTLEYLLPLLQSSKIKVSVSTAIIVKKGVEANLKPREYVFDLEKTIVYDKVEQAEQAIEDIRIRWASYKVREDAIRDMINASDEESIAWSIRSTFEQLGVLFALPESGCF